MTNERALADFEAAISTFPDTVVAWVTYIARKAEPLPYIVKARLNLHGVGTTITPRLFTSDEIVAETFALAPLNLTPGEVIRAALQGTVATPQGSIAFLPQVTGGFAAIFIPLHPEVLTQETRTGVLQIRGTDQAGHWQNSLLDWGLRSASIPYDNLNELSVDFGMGALIEPSTIFEAVAGNVVAVDLDRRVTGDKATLGMLAMKGLDRSKISLGYRVLDKNAVAARSTISGEDMTWIEENTREIGSAEIVVPPASLVNCYARYAGVTYHSGWIVDPTLAQNPRRSAYERFDPGLHVLTDLLAPKDKRFSREFESAVSCLMWMLGFDTCHLGGTKVLQDGPDILGMTPLGHVIVVECTIGALKTDSKMTKLLSRVAAVRDQLAKSGHGHLRVLPVMVTALPHSEIAAETDDAISRGVYVVTGDDFSEAITRTQIPPHADQLFVEAEQSLQGQFDAQVS